MAISLDSLVRTATLSQSANLAIAKRSGSAMDAFDAANQRVEQQLNSTTVKLSSFSQIKSGFADIQATANNLSNPKKTSTADDIVKAAQSFAAAYNTATNSVNLAVKGDGKKSGVLAGDARTSIASNDLKRIVSTDSNVADLKKIGINLKSDGTISVDTAALKSAIQANSNGVKDTLSKVGKLADQISTKELATTGNVGGSVNALSNLSKGLETQLAEQKKLAAASQDTVKRQVASISSTASSGVASYLQMLSL